MDSECHLANICYHSLFRPAIATSALIDLSLQASIKKMLKDPRFEHSGTSWLYVRATTSLF